jgi:hypothetical protein
VSRIQDDISEALSMLFEMYQDWAPPGLGERLFDKDGKALFPNLSIETLRGQSQVQLTPDVVAGSKAYRKQLQMWAIQTSQGNPFMSPQVNPVGNYNFWSDSYKEMLGFSDSEIQRWMGKPPKGSPEDLAEVEAEWERFMQGEDFEPPEGETMMAMYHMQGHMKQKEEQYQDLAKEYRPNFDAHLFKTMVNYMKFMKNAQKEQMANMLASQMIMSGQAQPPGQGAIAQPGANAGQPGGMQPPMPGAQPMPEQGLPGQEMGGLNA